MTAIKYTITEQPQPIDNMLKQCIGQFLILLEDQDLVSSLVNVSIVEFYTILNTYTVSLVQN